MSGWKKHCKALLFPPLWVILLLAAVSSAALVAVFLRGLENTIPAYGVYALSAYALTVLCILLVRVLPGSFRRARQRIHDHPLGHRYLTDAAFRVRVSLYLSLGINLGYSALKLAAGIYYRSTWLWAVAIYYIVLALLRFLLLRYLRSDDSRRGLLQEYRRCRLCGAVMVVLNLTLTGMVFQVVWQNEGYHYPGFLIFAAAAYTFYSVTISIVDLVRYRKYQSPVLSAAKAIRFASALVSLLALETAMLAQFGNDEAFRLLMTALTGTGVCVTVLAVSSYMIVHSTRKIEQLKR